MDSLPFVARSVRKLYVRLRPETLAAYTFKLAFREAKGLTAIELATEQNNKVVRVSDGLMVTFDLTEKALDIKSDYRVGFQFIDNQGAIAKQFSVLATLSPNYAQ